MPKLKSIDIHLLQVFGTVVECGGFSAAEAELNVSQSTISRQIADLETRLGVRLCNRGRSGFALTDEGARVCEASRRLFDALESYDHEVDGIRRKPAGDLDVGSIDSLIFYPGFPLPDAIARFRLGAEGVRLRLHVNAPLEIERAVVEERYQIGIGPFEFRENKSLIRHKLFTERQLLYCGRGHEFFARADGDIGDEEIDETPLAERGYISVAQAPDKARYNAAATAYTDEGVAQFILSGHYTGFLPVHYAEHWTAQGLMRAVAPERYGYEGEFFAITRGRLVPGRAADLFLETLLDVCAARQAAE